jgi:hypothetical protein
LLRGAELRQAKQKIGRKLKVSQLLESLSSTGSRQPLGG